MAGRKQVLMLLSNPFRPDPRVNREALSLIKAGYGVKILCWDREQNFPPDESVDGIEIIRLGPASGYGRSSGFIGALRKFWANIGKAAADIQFDIIHSHDLDTLSPGLKLASKRKIPLIYDSHEIYHEMASENLSGIPLKLLASYERRMVRKPKILITVNEPIARIFKRYGARDVRVVMNCQPDAVVNEERARTLRLGLSPDGKPILLYIGVLEPHRLLLETAKAHLNASNDFIFVLGGFGSLEPQIRALADKSEGRIRFIGRIHPSEVPAYNHASDILLTTYDPALRNNRMGAPNKLFEAMMAARPIVVSKGTYSAKVVDKVGCGICVDYDGKAAVASISELLADGPWAKELGLAGRQAYENKYNWLVMEKRLLAVYRDIID